MPTHSVPQVNRPQPRSPESRRVSDRLRMRANCISALVVLALLLIGGWAENGFVNAMRDSGTCYRPGGSDCAAIYVPAPHRS
jgi:hypothetical protein